MLHSYLSPNNKAYWRKKAQTNICMAKELADIFGGAKADYLKKLNHRLRIKIADNSDIYSHAFAEAA
jgi:hypothetical protein